MYELESSAPGVNAVVCHRLASRIGGKSGRIGKSLFHGPIAMTDRWDI